MGLRVVWALCLALVLGWRVCAHLVFRRRVLARARPAQDPAVLALWRAEQERVERKRPIPLLVSPDVRSPMTVGVFDRGMRALLPEREYSPEDLNFIFRHELRHVQRRDVDTKLFCAFCQALCWFNPLVWIATRAACADLELSCDEMVLYGADEKARRDYAGLLLDGAGDERGFTTCLSASAQSLRYRLRNVVEPRKRFSGTALLGLVMAALALCNGLVAVSGQSGTVGEAVFSRYGEVELRSLTSRRGDPSEIGNYTSCTGDEADPAILAQLAELPVTRIGMGERFLEEGERCLTVNLSSAEGWLWMDLSERFLEVDGPDGKLLYMLDGPVDWDDLDAFLGPRANA